MSAPTPRRWFQLHLSTCVVLMFVCGGFLVLNIQSKMTVEPGCVGTQWEAYNKRLSCGWPFPFYCFWTAEGQGISGSIEAARRDRYDERDILAAADKTANWEPVPLLSDLGLFVLALLTSGMVLEHLARRREARKP